MPINCTHARKNLLLCVCECVSPSIYLKYQIKTVFLLLLPWQPSTFTKKIGFQMMNSMEMIFLVFSNFIIEVNIFLKLYT